MEKTRSIFINILVGGKSYLCMCMYKLGSCPNGPNSHYRHQKLLGPPSLVEHIVFTLFTIIMHMMVNLELPLVPKMDHNWM